MVRGGAAGGCGRCEGGRWRRVVLVGERGGVSCGRGGGRSGGGSVGREVVGGKRRKVAWERLKEREVPRAGGVSGVQVSDRSGCGVWSVRGAGGGGQRGSKEVVRRKVAMGGSRARGDVREGRG